ncbi:MAG: imidazole glycerol phosphate synthase subunit HisH [Verrucomicrobia bacterium]|nr:MAG: imidazole glycerol phosphate synthase subunit HisH [Verrucomicrobiota bacterium]
MITIVNYGLGNISAFANIYKILNIPVTIAGTTDQLAAAEKIILPGVGAFDWAMMRLEQSGMRACLDDLVLCKKRPVLGVCVGMQMMADRSAEGKLPGLGWISGEVLRFNENDFRQQTHLPHMGWNDVEPARTECLFKGIPVPRYYFLHSYYFATAHPSTVLAKTDYNGHFAAAVRFENIFGTQFHPEKSHNWGIQLLKNFAEI